MRKVNVEIAEDASRSEGGYAVVLLHGVTSLPDGVRFRIKPVDARDAAESEQAESWPKGEHRPVAVRSTEFGVELVIGPEIVECPALLPGTVGVIEIGQAGVRGEFLWPSIRPTARPRRRHLSLVKPHRTSGAASPAAAVVVVAPAPARLPSNAAHGGPDAVQAEIGRAASPIEPVPVEQHDIVVRASVEMTASELASARPGDDIDPSLTADAMLAAAQDRTAVSAPPPLPLSYSAAEPVAAVATASPASERPQSAVIDEPPPATSVFRTRYGALAAACIAVLLVGSYVFWGSSSPAIDAASKAVRPATAAVVRTATEAVVSDVAARTVKPESFSRSPRAGDDQTRREEIQDAAARQQAASIPPVPESGATAPTATGSEPSTKPVSKAPATTPELETATGSEVTLRMRGGGFQVTGELKGFDGTKYVIETRSSGVMTMDASRFECQGAACARPAAAILAPAERPNPLRPDNYVIEGSMALGAEFVPQLIKAYAASIGATAAPLGGGTDRSTKYRISDTRGIELATITIEAQTSATALAALEQGNAALALIERPVGSDEDVRAGAGTSAKRAPAIVEYAIGLDGIAAVVAPKREMVSVSLDTLAKLFSGQITDWVELGMAPGQVQLYLPQEASGTAELFNRLVLKPRNLKPAGAATALKTDVEAAEAVIRDPNGIALVSFAAMKGVRPLNIETQCGLIARPTSFGVKTEEYPLARRLSLAAPALPTQPSARGIVRMAQSPDVVRAVGLAGLVDQSIAALTIAEQSERMAWAINAPAASFDMAEMRQMLADLAGFSRLSLTLRFNANNELDARSRKEIGRLAAALKEPDLAGKRVLLAGFTDAGGRFQPNLTLGLKRAGQVRAALLTAAGPGLDQRLVTAKGYGPLAPVGCSNTADGQRLNRRVEVWVASDVQAKSAAR